MANAVLFLKWNHPRPGNEEKAYGWLATEGVAYLKKNEGKYFERMEVIALTPHASDMNGCIVLFGERAKLDEWRRTDEFEAFSMQLGRQFDRYGVVPGLNWDGIQGVMKRMESAPKP
jgi:hypothetical protein